MKSIVSTIKAYWISMLLFSAAMFFQLFVIPNSFPPSHYEVLGVKSYGSIEEVKDAYEKLSSKWESGSEVPEASDFIKFRYAFELLTNSLWKRDYDVFDIDEQFDLIETLKEKHLGHHYTEINLPLLDVRSYEDGGNAVDNISSKDLPSLFGDTTNALLIQVYSTGSNRSAQFSTNWKRIGALLDGIANTGAVEIGDLQFAAYLAEKKPTGKPFFRNGVPSLVAFPPGCRTSNCLVRYHGDLSVDAVIDWFSTTILRLPRIFYYTKESLGPDFIAKSGAHKVKVIFFSQSGERATPIVRQAAKDYSDYASFAFVLWRKEEFSTWWNTFEVESAPAIVIMKDPGVKPVVHQGHLDNNSLFKIMEQHKHQELPQLRSVTSMDLGCDPRGYSRAGKDTTIWYCVVVAGRLSQELNKMRETIRRVQKALTTDDVSNDVEGKEESAISAAALKEKRLSFAWLDGEAQKAYCFFYLHSEYSYETCGARRDASDVPQIFIVRYKRNDTEDVIKVEKKPKSILDAFQDDEVDPASQLVAKFNGSAETSEIVKWISGIIKDGDTRDLPFFRTKTPELTPEDADPVWKKGAQSIDFTRQGLKQKTGSFFNAVSDLHGDPRIGPILLLAALMSFGTIWLRRSQSIPDQSNPPTQTSPEDEAKAKAKQRARRPRPSSSSKYQIPSMTDNEPKGAYQVPQLDSDSD